MSRQSEGRERRTNTDTRRHCCTASCSHSAAAKGRGGCQKMRKHTTSNDPMWERQKRFGQNCIAQTEAGSQTDSHSWTGRQVFSRHTKKTAKREREAGVLAALLQADQWGCWIRDCVKQNTTPKKQNKKNPSCRAKKPHAPWFSASSETQVNHPTHVHTHTHTQWTLTHTNTSLPLTRIHTEGGAEMERWRDDVSVEEV